MLWHEHAILTQSWLNRGLSCAQHLCFKFLCQSFVGFATINFKTMWPFVLQLYRALVGRARERGKRGKCGFNLKLPPFVSNEHPSLPPPLTHGVHVILRSTLGGFLIWRPQRFGIFPLPTLYPLNLYCTVCTQMRTPSHFFVDVIFGSPLTQFTSLIIINIPVAKTEVPPVLWLIGRANYPFNFETETTPPVNAINLREGEREREAKKRDFATKNLRWPRLVLTIRVISHLFLLLISHLHHATKVILQVKTAPLPSPRTIQCGNRLRIHQTTPE